jgi:DNA repair exonuclease SbcCD ATPase subunit
MQDLERERTKENPHVQHLDSLKGTLQPVDFDEINRLVDLQRHQDFLMKLLTNKDSFVRKKIIDQNLYYLNTRLNFYLEKLGLPHEVVFQNDLTTDITLLGRDFDFEQLSRGEMNRVIMSVSWAFRDVWESLNQTINLIWVDELIDNGLDSQGAEAALAIMKSFSRNRKNVFLISHRDELVGRIDRTLLVSKDNGFTTITEDLS